MNIILMTILDVIVMLHLWNVCTQHETSAGYEGELDDDVVIDPYDLSRTLTPLM